MPIDIDKVMKTLEKETKEYKVPVVDFMKISRASPYKLLVATILSSRTRDETTSEACNRLFAVAPDFSKLEDMGIDVIESLIYPVGFYKTKSRHLYQLARIINQEHNGKVPNTIPELTKLPGVGRKTANLVLAVAFNIPAICVDTHVHRIMNRIGYVRTKTPLQTEMRLRKKLPVKHWLMTNKVFVTLGQHICTPISPFCSRCPIRDECRQIGVATKR